MHFIYCRLCCTAHLKALTCHVMPLHPELLTNRLAAACEAMISTMAWHTHHTHYFIHLLCINALDSLASVQGAHLHCAIRCSERENTGEHSVGTPARPGLVLNDGCSNRKADLCIAPRVAQPEDLFVCDMEEKDISCPPAWKRLKKSQCTPLFMNAYTMRGEALLMILLRQ